MADTSETPAMGPVPATLPRGIVHGLFGLRQDHHVAGSVLDSVRAGGWTVDSCSADDQSFVYGHDELTPSRGAWWVVFQGVFMHSYLTREDARAVIRAYTADPGLAQVALVLAA